ncbi:hypothetical protein HAX54_035331, partial [Datura stramonium]|nr:hypothetical protein [Datura stramonium]
AQLVSIRFQFVSGDVAMLTCELMRKYQILVIMKCNKGGKERSILTGGTNSPFCVLFNGFRCSKVCLTPEVDRHSGSAAVEK